MVSRVYVNNLHVVYPGNQRIYSWANIDNLSEHIVRSYHLKLEYTKQKKNIVQCISLEFNKLHAIVIYEYTII